MKTVSTIIQWLIIVAIIAAIWFFCHTKLPGIDLNPITGFQVILFALSLAFTWVYVLGWFKFIKPFSCMKCMTGWLALIIALIYHVPNAVIYLFIGLFIGGLFEAIKMRWL